MSQRVKHNFKLTNTSTHNTLSRHKTQPVGMGIAYAYPLT
jgi:hypothetical protein